LSFFYYPLRNISHSKTKSARYYYTWKIGLHVEYKFFLIKNLIKLECSQISRKYMLGEPKSSMRADGRTHGHDRIVAFRILRTRLKLRKGTLIYPLGG
jgi:hypothetical protein